VVNCLDLAQDLIRFGYREVRQYSKALKWGYEHSFSEIAGQSSVLESFSHLAKGNRIEINSLWHVQGTKRGRR